MACGCPVPSVWWRLGAAVATAAPPAPAGDRAEVEGQLQAAALPVRRSPSRAAGPARDDRRRHRPVRSASRSSSPGRRPVLTLHPGQPLHERAELVLAEEPDDLGSVVVAQARRAEVELDGRESVDGHELAPEQDVVAVLA